MKKIILFFVALGFTSVGFAQKADSTKKPTITLRSASLQGTEPLIVIDGNKQYFKGSTLLNAIDPDNIDSIHILKDVSAITKYGTDGQAGVIEIKTKNGLAGIYNKPIDSSIRNLKGKITGLSVRPRTKPQYEIRNLLQKDSDAKAKPMYVLDGKRIDDISNLDPETIDSISVLKEVAGKSLYGNQAKNGVVIITTKTSNKGIQKKN